MKFTKLLMMVSVIACTFSTISSFATPSNSEWRIATGEFETTADSIKATGTENYVWTPGIYENFELLFTATKSPKSDFRINIGSTSPQSTGRKGQFYQILIPWEGGDSRIDSFSNGRVVHIFKGFKNIDKEQYQVRLKMNDQLLKIWIDNQLHIEIILRDYEKGYVGFSSMAGIQADKIQWLQPRHRKPISKK